jgi:serine/threonine protein kinase
MPDTPDKPDGAEAAAIDPDTGRKIPRTIRLFADNALPSPSNEEWVAAGSSSGSLRTQYAVLDKIGDGGMGIVYLARDHKLGRYVALKRLNSTSLSNHSLKSRFFREARAVAALNHVHIVHIYSLGEDDEGPYIVMEYVAGPMEASPGKIPPSAFSLADRVHRDGPLPVADALELMVKICHAMEYAHGCKVIHRDLKPSNVLLDGNYEPKIVDFGLARKMNPGTLRLTVPGEKMLSLGYSAPEQESDATLSDERADVYGLGALLYFSLTGKNPRYFRESEMPENLRMPIVKALEPDQKKRWPTVKDFTAALMLVKVPNSAIELPTIKSTWRCKWCDSVNPVLIRFCGKCGWDGGETCVECGSETRVGVQFCGACGANAREYEIARLLMQRISQHEEEKAYELIVQQAGQISSFKPTGPGGDRLVERIHRHADDARRALERKGKLRQFIAQDLERRNYDLAEQHIREYDSLANDDAYAHDKQRLPVLRAEQDLERAREAISIKDWALAARLCHDLRATSSAGDPRLQKLTRSLLTHRWEVRMRNTALVALGVFAVYVLSAAPAYRVAGRGTNRLLGPFYGLAALLHEETVLGRPMEVYARWWGAQAMYQPPIVMPPIANPPVAQPPVKQESAEQLAAMREKFEKNLVLIQAERRKQVDAWPDEYLNQLVATQLAMQKRGDFDGWSAATTEIERFRQDRKLPEPSEDPAGGTASRDPPPRELRDVQKAFLDRIESGSLDESRKILQLSRSYLGDLGNLQKDFTKKGLMDAALAVNTEMKRVRTSPAVILAEEAVSKHASPKPGAKPGSPAPGSPPGG